MLLSFLVSAALAQNAIGNAQEAMRKRLRDPSSAQFETVYITETGVVCGFVNAKNSYGGYAGKTPFVSLNTTMTMVAKNFDIVVESTLDQLLGYATVQKNCSQD